MLIWGLDKLVDVEHGIRVSEGFYLGLFSQPLLLIITGATVLVAWRSILDRRRDGRSAP